MESNVKDILYGSKTLRRTIWDRIKKNKLSPYWLCRQEGVRISAFYTWMKSFDVSVVPVDDRLAHWEIIALCDRLKIDIRVRLVLAPDSEINKEGLCNIKMASITRWKHNLMEQELNKLELDE